MASHLHTFPQAIPPPGMPLLACSSTGELLLTIQYPTEVSPPRKPFLTVHAHAHSGLDALLTAFPTVL